MNFKFLFYNICFPFNKLNLINLRNFNLDENLLSERNNIVNFNVDLGYFNIYIGNGTNSFDIIKKIHLYQNDINYLIYFNNTNIKSITNKTLYIDKINYFTKETVYKKQLKTCN